MAIQVSDNDQNLKRRGRPPKKEKLFRRWPMAMVGFIEKKQVIQRGSPPAKKKQAVIGYVEKKQVKCRKRKMSNRELDSDCGHSSAMDRAQAIQASLGPEFPSFVKDMLHSHVVRGFWLGLPTKFCRMQMPKKDMMITLEDDSGEKHEAKYLFEKRGLSGGWRGYAMDHNLVEGDVLVFHLVTPSKFKIYTVRGGDSLDGVRDAGSDEVNCPYGLLKLDECAQQVDYRAGDLPESTRNDIQMVEASSDVEPISQSDSEVEHQVSLVQSLQEMKSIDSFNITVNGLVVNSKFPKHVQTKYYDLCWSQQSYLHKHLLEGISLDLAIAAIAEITNIADGIRASSILTPRKELVTWDTTLKGFEIFGMSVSFLRARIDQLMSLIDEMRQCSEAKREQVHAREELRKLVLQVNELIVDLDVEIESLDSNTEKLESMFHEVANGPWGRR